MSAESDSSAVEWPATPARNSTTNMTALIQRTTCRMRRWRSPIGRTSQQASTAPVYRRSIGLEYRRPQSYHPEHTRQRQHGASPGSPKGAIGNEAESPGYGRRDRGGDVFGRARPDGLDEDPPALPVGPQRSDRRHQSRDPGRDEGRRGGDPGRQGRPPLVPA